MGRRNAILWVATALVAVVTAAAVLGRPADVRLSDLSVYLGATADLDAGLYDFIRGHAPFTYPPFAALPLHPLTWLPTTVVQVAWTTATIGVVLGIARLARPDAAALALVLMLSAPVSSDLKYGQVSLFLAALILADVLLLRRTPWFGALIGLAAAIKLTPLILIPLLWLVARRAAVTATATFIGCGLLGALALPAESWRFWTEAMFQVSRLGFVSNVGNQSLNGALLRLDVAPDVRSLLVLTVGGTIAAVALWRAARLARRGDWLGATIVAGAASVVLSPVSWTHHQIWLVLAVLLPVRVPRALWTATVLAVMLLPVTALGTPLFGNARLWLAITIAAVVPLVARAEAPKEEQEPEQTIPPYAATARPPR